MDVLIKNIIVKNNRISADVYVNQEKNEVWYEFPWNMENITTFPANAFLVAFMPIAMRFGGKIEIEGEISQSLYNQMQTYQDIMTKWYSELTHIEIYAKKISNDIISNNKRKTISCFTGGVDAFYTLIKNQEKINTLLYVWGFDIPLVEEAFFSQVQSHLSAVAKSFKKEIIFVKTNLGFEVTNKYASWGDYCYGSAIASVILFMTNKYELCLMPSCNDYSVLVPRGSHVLINHLWSCNGVKFVYDGAEASRIEKVDKISDNELVKNHLRVCYKSNDIYNCCECEKCIRTMSSLEAVNKLDKVKTFHKPLILQNIGKIKLSNYSELKFAEATRSFALKNNKTELAEQLNQQIVDYNSRNILQYLNENFDTLLNNKDFFDFSRRITDWHIEHNTKYTAKKLTKEIGKKILK